MTVLRVTTEPGKFDEGTRSRLAESLTMAILDVEGGSDN